MNPEQQSNLDRLLTFQNEAINEVESAMHRVRTIEKLIETSLLKAGISRPVQEEETLTGPPSVSLDDPFNPVIIHGGKTDGNDDRTPDIA